MFREVYSYTSVGKLEKCEACMASNIEIGFLYTPKNQLLGIQTEKQKTKK